MTQATEHGGRLNVTTFVLTVALALVLFTRSGQLTGTWGVGLFAFLLLAVLVEGYPLQVPFAKAFISQSGTLFLALFVLYPPSVAALGAYAAFFAAELLFHQRSLAKKAFNATQTGLSVFVGAYCFEMLQGSVGLEASPTFFLVFGISALAYWASNTWLVSIGAWALYGELPHRFWRKNFQWTFVYELTSAPIALVVAYAYQELALIGLLLVILPIFLVRLAYSQYVQLKKTYGETVRTLVKVIEMHDPYTAGHSDRVATYSRRLCEALDLSPSQTEKIELAAYLHDLGKIHLDLAGIVRKPGKLTDEEFRLIRLHSVVSADLANQVTYFQGEIEAIIRHHHENWDGTGYPHGLKGEEIPLGARVILLSDAFDAMTTSRIYRDALDLKKVKSEFRKFAGIQFDPSLVPVFLEKVVGDGSNLVPQQFDELLEGRAASILQHADEVEVHPLSKSAIG